jgi:hypothetical protein
MTTALSLILALMLSIGGSPASGVNPASVPGNTGIQAPIDNSCTINRFFEDYTQKTASRADSKKIPGIPLINHPKTQNRLSFQLCLKEKLYLRGYIDSMNLYQAFNVNPINFIDPMGTLKFKSILKGAGSFAKNVAIGAVVVVGVAVTAPVSLPVAFAIGGGALTLGITNSISNRIADNQTSKQVVSGILPDMTGASGLFAGGTGYDIITLEDLNLDEGQRAECIGGGLGQLTVISSAKWGYNKVNRYIAPKIKPYTENTFELMDQAFNAFNNSQKGVSIVPYDPVQFNAIIDSEGLTIHAEGRITGPHPGRTKSYVPGPVGGKSPGHHKGHLVAEGLVEEPSLINVKENIISEAARSNLSAKRIFENIAGRIANENPGAIVKTHHMPVRLPGNSVPYEVYHYITVNGKIVHGEVIKNE